MTENTSAHPNTWVDPITGRWVLVVTILASSMAFIDGSALNVALPALQRDLGATGTDLLWLINAYALMLAALILVGGSLGDIYGRKRVFGIGIALFALASLVCGLSPTTGVLIGARAVQGIGGALMIPGSLAIISAAFGPGDRGKAIGTWSGATTLVTVLGPALGGFLADAGLWRGVFLLNLPLAVVAIYLLIRCVPESRDETVKPVVDIPGAALATLGLGGLTFGFIHASEAGFSDPLVIGTLGGGALALILFIVVERRSDHPMMPLYVFKSRTFSGANLLTLFLYGALYAVLFFFPLNLVQAQGYRESIAGFTFLPFTLLLSVLSRWAGGLVDRFGPRLPLVVGPVLVGVGFILFSLPGLTEGPKDYWTTFFPAVTVMGLGMSIVVAPLVTAVMGSVASSHAGVASGVNNAVSRTAGVLAIAIMGAIAIIAFRGALIRQTADLNLSAGATEALLAEASKLGDAGVPASVPAAQAEAADQAIKRAFVDVFRLLSLIGAALAFASALAAGLVIEKRMEQIE